MLPTRRRARSALKTLVEQVQRLDPSRLALPSPRRDTYAVGFVAVYRAEHAGRLHRIVRSLARGTSVRLWSLDEVPETLRACTVGHGPGMRFQLLNRLAGSIPADARRDGLIVSDDDYVLRVGTLAQLLDAGRGMGLDLWQPAHARNSWVSYPFVRRRPGLVARRTTFVEQGPVIVLSARAQRLLLPLPESIGMAWGAEIAWYQAAVDGRLTLGIVDAVAVHHLAPLGGYDRTEQAEQLALMLRDAGKSSLGDLQTELSRVGLREGWSRLRGFGRRAGARTPH